MRTLAFVFALVALSTPAALAEPPASDDAAAIRAELDREAAAWNRGDLDGYLAGYERAATTTMIGRTQLYRGFDAIAAMYHQHYGDKARMGRLRFDELEVRPLGAGFALAIGRWQLARDAAAGGPVGGFFTLTLHKGPGGWHIVVDHTS
jgi:ketosteroid isomerase-like protein